MQPLCNFYMATVWQDIFAWFSEQTNGLVDFIFLAFILVVVYYILRRVSNKLN